MQFTHRHIISILILAVNFTTKSEAQEAEIVWYPYHLLDYNLKLDSTKLGLVFFFNQENEWCLRQLKEELEDQGVQKILSEKYVAIMWNINHYKYEVFFDDFHFTYNHRLKYHGFFKFVTDHYMGTPYFIILDNQGNVLNKISGFTKARNLIEILR